MKNLLKSKIITATFLLVSALSSAHASVITDTVLTDAGVTLNIGETPAFGTTFPILVGASNVPIGNTLFDVSFVDGSCEELFNGCDSNDDFTFNSATEATQAAQVLLDLVLINVDEFTFASSPGFVAGFDLFETSPQIFIPFAPQDNGFITPIASQNVFGNFRDFITQQSFLAATDTTSFGARNFAIFSEVGEIAPTEVPSPATIMIFALGLLALGLRRKFNK